MKNKNNKFNYSLSKPKGWLDSFGDGGGLQQDNTFIPNQRVQSIATPKEKVKNAFNRRADEIKNNPQSFSINDYKAGHKEPGLEQSMDPIDLVGTGIYKGLAKGAMNLAKPLVEDIAIGAEKAIQNTYKINPWAFKPNPKAYYRQVDNVTYNEGLESGLIRGKQDIGYSDESAMKMFGDDAYYNKGRLYYKNEKDYPYLFEANLPEDRFIPKVNGRTRKYTTENTRVRVSKEPLPINDPNITIYKKDWLKGYKEVPKPTINAIKPTTSIKTNNMLPENMHPYVSKKVTPASREEEVYNSFLSPQGVAKNIEKRTTRFDNKGNIIKKNGGWLDKLN